MDSSRRAVLSGLGIGIGLKKNNKFYISFFYAILGAVGCLFIPYERGYHNISLYMISIVAFISIFILMMGLLAAVNKFDKNFNDQSIFYNSITIGVFVLCSSIFLQWYIFEQKTENAFRDGSFNDFPKIFNIILALALFVVIVRTIYKDLDIDIVTEYVIYAISIVLTFMMLSGVNIFTELSNSEDYIVKLASFVPVTNSIYNVASGVPYTISTSSLYGHYGLFFAIPLKFWFGPMLIDAIMALIALAGAIGQTATIYIIHKFAPKRWIGALFALASIVRTSYYIPAISPLRTVFPLITFAFMTYIHDKEYKKYMIPAYGIISMAILWNTETGIACLLGFSAYILIREWQQSIFSGGQIKFYIKMLFLSALSLAVPVLIVNMYNFANGYKIFEISSFFYPITATEFVRALVVPIKRGNTNWIYVLVLLFFCLSYAVYNTKIFLHKEIKVPKEVFLMGGGGTIGIVVFLYYINEPFWDYMNVVHQICFALLTLIIYILWKYVNNRTFVNNAEGAIKRSVALLFILVAATYSLRVPSDFNRIRIMQKLGAYENANVYQDIVKLSKKIPENTYGVGLGIEIIYQALGWDNRCYLRDISGISMGSSQSEQEMVDEILSKDSFLISYEARGQDQYSSKVFDKVMKQNKGKEFKYIKSVYVRGIEYRYFSR